MGSLTISSSFPLLRYRLSLPLPLLNDDDPPPPLVDCEKDSAREEDWLRCACFENRVSRSADLDFFSCSAASAALRFRWVPARVRDLRGLVLGLRVVEGLEDKEDAVPARVVRLRIGLGLGEAVVGALLLLEVTPAVAGLAGEAVVSFFFGEGMRNRFRVFLFWSWSSSESSSAMARLRRFAGGAIASVSRG
jgi:hypothetical protein